MITEYKISVDLLFEKETARDEWYKKIKTLLINQKETLASYKSIVIAKDESFVSERVSENI